MRYMKKSEIILMLLSVLITANNFHKHSEEYKIKTKSEQMLPNLGQEKKRERKIWKI